MSQIKEERASPTTNKLNLHVESRDTRYTVDKQAQIGRKEVEILIRFEGGKV
jgi:hypothetical protein